jgi:hypothetical protein
MAEIRVSTGALSDMIKLYEKLLKDASGIAVERKDGSREPMTAETRQTILDSLESASQALASGCPEGVYGLFLTD